MSLSSDVSVANPSEPNLPDTIASGSLFDLLEKKKNNAVLRKACDIIFKNIDAANIGGGGHLITYSSIGMNDNFAKDWGLDSLQMLRLGLDLEKEFGFHIESLSDFEDKQLTLTVGELLEIFVTNKKADLKDLS